MFKDTPDEWHTLPTTKKGLMMIPLTKEACDRQSTSIVPTTTEQTTQPTTQSAKKKKKNNKKDLVCHQADL